MATYEKLGMLGNVDVSALQMQYPTIVKGRKLTTGELEKIAGGQGLIVEHDGTKVTRAATDADKRAKMRVGLGYADSMTVPTFLEAVAAWESAPEEAREAVRALVGASSASATGSVSL